MSGLWHIYSANLVLLLGIMSFMWIVSLRQRDPSVVDIAWPFGFAILAMASAHRQGWDIVAAHYVIIAMVLAWSLRLAFHLFERWSRQGPDRRYDGLLARAVGPKPLFTLVAIFWFQALALWLVALPIQEVMQDPYPPFGIAGAAGLLLFLAGFTMEVVADRQLARFKEDPAHEKSVLDTGLWRYSRHPNYFGEICIHWGFWLFAIADNTGGWTAIGPAFLTFTLVKWTGVPMVEKHLAETRPGYADYAARTSMLVPWPPGKS